MERYVVSRELAEKLKEAGYLQNTEYYWSDQGNEDWMVLSKSSDWLNMGRDIAAPISDELLEQLKPVQPIIWFSGFGSWEVETQVAGIEESEQAEQTGQRPPDVLAKLWLYCKEHGYLEASQGEK